LNVRVWLPRVVLTAALAGAALWLLLTQDRSDLSALAAALRGLDEWAPAAFVAGFALATVLFVPGSILGLAGGALFGPAWGAVWNLAGATLGATLAFLVGRYLASGWVTRRAAGRTKQLVEGVEAEGWRFVALMRLVPLVPFNLLNYALGLTRIRLAHYAVATGVCMAPGAAAYAWLGYAGREAAAGSSGALGYGAVGLALLALAIFLPRLVRRFRNGTPQWISIDELKRRLDVGAAIAVVDVRGPEEFGGPLGHIPGARNVPLGDLARAPGELAGLGGRPIVLVCRTDKRSALAAEVLQSAGFRDVLVLRGGMLQWQRDAADVRAPAPLGVRT
jgi:uncharacterized membrane protein YdjX (TVP38/TMEM64 family)/rhodanese-related sulfurtransferase